MVMEFRWQKLKRNITLKEAERVCSLMAADRTAASEKIFVFSFDLEKTLEFPNLTTSVAYYKQNLYVYTSVAMISMKI